MQVWGPPKVQALVDISNYVEAVFEEGVFAGVEPDASGSGLDVFARQLLLLEARAPARSPRHLPASSPRAGCARAIRRSTQSSVSPR